MSYSISVKAATRAEALALLPTEFDRLVVGPQPIHAKDKDAVVANATAVAGLVPEQEGRDIVISVNGYVSWKGASHSDQRDVELELLAASVSCTVSYVDRVVEGS